jgi:hypothetical protein
MLVLEFDRPVNRRNWIFVFLVLMSADQAMARERMTDNAVLKLMARSGSQSGTIRSLLPKEAFVMVFKMSDHFTITDMRAEEEERLKKACRVESSKDCMEEQAFQKEFEPIERYTLELCMSPTEKTGTGGRICIGVLLHDSPENTAFLRTFPSKEDPSLVVVFDDVYDKSNDSKSEVEARFMTRRKKQKTESTQ